MTDTSDQRPVALITGAGRGIGRASAVALGAAGYRLGLVSRTAGELEETARLSGGEAVVVTADVTRSSDVERAIRETLARFGRLDAAVHCAGLAPVAPIAGMSDEQWHAVLDANLSAAFYLMRAAWPIFQKQRGGVVVNVSSVATRDPFPGFAAYAAAKAGVNLLGLCGAKEGQPDNIRVHTVSPGSTETAMFRSIVTPEQWPAEKTLNPVDVAAVIADCVTGRLRHTNGEVIQVHKTL